MILIQEKLISNDILQQQFVCNLNACKGVCCVEGDEGAPLADKELGILEDIYDEVVPYLTEKGKETIAKKGHYVMDSTDGFATPLMKGGACAYITYNELGIASCGIQKAYNDGAVKWMKPISCHLYPIRVSKQKYYEVLNYDRWDICSPACKLGKSLQVKVYEFLKEPLIRKYGKDFYQELDNVAKDLYG
ncbi:MAG: DUF3109 family protein [Chitinophagales bacterium]